MTRFQISPEGQCLKKNLSQDMKIDIFPELIQNMGTLRKTPPSNRQPKMKTTLLLTLTSCMVASAATLSHRYSFDTDTTDSVGGNTGTLQGGATVSSGALQLTGLGTNTSGNHMGFTSPVDIGGNFGASGVTIESWYTDSGTGTWGKLFQFGNSAAGQEFAYTHARGGGEQSGVDRAGAKLFGEQVSLNEEHHIVLSVSSDGNLNTWVDGVQKLTNVATNELSNVTTAFEGIGATSWNDPGMNGSVNEFRVWSGELTGQEVALNNTLGPNVVPEPSGLAFIFLSGLAALRRRRA